MLRPVAVALLLAPTSAFRVVPGSRRFACRASTIQMQEAEGLEQVPEDATDAADAAVEEEPRKLSPMAQMRKNQEAKAAEAQEWRDDRPQETVNIQTAFRGGFAVLMLAAGFALSQAGLDLSNLDFGESAASQSTSSAPNPGFQRPVIKTGYENDPNLGKARPLFRPADASTAP